MGDTGQLAYLAGFFDGERCVYIPRARKTGWISYRLEIRFTNCELAPLLLAQVTFGSQISASKPPDPERARVHRLTIRSSQAAAALRAMLPFLLIKRRRAELAVEFQERLSERPGTRRLPADACEEYKTAITQMNDKIWNSRPAAY